MAWIASSNSNQPLDFSSVLSPIQSPVAPYETGQVDLGNRPPAWSHQ